ncbi:hypothetical protein FSARC_1873 [Fusarium sarcochroum]|uniref:Rhodopsin domain-containing protein n=1 Tax=Fusarium sarcochroum TaxID=1208366 RepID=A0A8H4XEG4_9HYPO|nr:hypothetical protein FSARC_1873 [Fusarium sarcochroum]
MAEINGTVVAVAPPEGYDVDFDNPQRNSVMAIYVVCGIGTSLALFFLFQRLFVKVFVRKNFGIDDGLSKTVILLFLLEINSTQKWYRWAVFGTMSIVASSSTGIFFASIFPCVPFRKSWDLTFPVGDGRCIDRPAMFQATAGLGVATDVMIIAIPISSVLGLHLSAKKKAALLCLFVIRSATVVTSMVRLALLISQLDKIDTTWGGGPIHIWICIEANLLIICACLSTLRHFVREVAPALLSSNKRMSTGRSGKALSSGYELHTIGGTSHSVKAGRYTQFDTHALQEQPKP